MKPTAETPIMTLKERIDAGYFEAPEPAAKDGEEGYTPTDAKAAQNDLDFDFRTAALKHCGILSHGKAKEAFDLAEEYAKKGIGMFWKGRYSQANTLHHLEKLSILMK